MKQKKNCLFYLLFELYSKQIYVLENIGSAGCGFICIVIHMTVSAE